MAHRRVAMAAVSASAAAIALAVLVHVLWTPARSVDVGRHDGRYLADVQTLFDRRCVVCHGCYDAPCQLNLQSFEGVDRGANARRVYEPSRLEAMAPTRMFEDARSTDAWRTRFDFFPVVARTDAEHGDLESSLLFRAVVQRRTAPGGGPFDVDATQVCPRNVEALDLVFRARPERGMPFGFPPLTDDEVGHIADWIRHGAGGVDATAWLESEAVVAEIAQWEAFLNDRDPRMRIVARYLYEHLYLAHLQLSSAPREWFRLVRSRTRAPAPIDEIATVRPYDDPHAPRFQYRLRRLRESIVVKTHVPYQLGPAKLARIRHLFLDADWGPASVDFPSYAPEVAANPFIAFRAIPARARYQFMLDDAHYHVETFIHGPVCKGQVALNVIDDHFLIFFLAPDADPSITHPEYLQRVAEHLAVPAEGGDGIEAIYERFHVHELAYVHAQSEFVRATQPGGRALGDIWNGDGTNRDAVLTVYRHYDSAYVVRGAVGGVPKTAWVLDYPNFERMYYDLVAGFDVFGNVVHQIATRRYMNLLRIEAEDTLLGFLPRAQRSAVRASWYRGAGVSLLVDVDDPFFGAPETRTVFRDTTDSKGELIRRLLAETLGAGVVGAREPIQWTDAPFDGAEPRVRFEQAARTLAAVPAPFVQVFPDSALLRVRVPGADDLVYTIVRNRSHLNIDFMFFEHDELAPAEDTLHIVRGIVTSRPNLFLIVQIDDIDAFAAAWRALRAGDSSWARFLDRYGSRRRDPTFWSGSDYFNDRFPTLDPLGAGILDLSRYVND